MELVTFLLEFLKDPLTVIQALIQEYDNLIYFILFMVVFVETGFVIMPLFALANAGMVINGSFFSSLMNPVSLGVVTGLILGKFVGVFSFTWLMIRLKVAELPEKANWGHILGVAILAGVGFTMSLFVTGLAYSKEEMIDQSKYGILIASVFCGIAGILVLKWAQKKTK